MSNPLIDLPLEAYWAKHGIQPNPICSDEIFLRRITLDLAGRIPTTRELKTFLAEPNRESKIDELLAAETFPEHWADLWTTMLNGYSNAFESDREALRLWLISQFKKEQSYDAIVTELVAGTGYSSSNGAVNFLIRYPEEPEVRVSRLFLGVQIDCARCHDHPFDRWTEDDFANLSRFFESMQLEERGGGNLGIVNHEVGGEKPKFLTGSTPRTRMWRDELALFMQHTKAFSKNFANRIWYQLVGRGIVHAPDNFNAKNPPAVPELLDSLSDFAKQTEWDFKAMIRQVCRSDAYQRSSFSAKKSEATTCFAVRPIKPLTAEQWYASVRVVSSDDTLPLDREAFLEQTFGRQVEDDFSETWKYRETVQQMMSQLTLDLNLRFPSHEAAYQAILSREMNATDRKICQGHTVSDVAFALVNSSEFFFNH